MSDEKTKEEKAFDEKMEKFKKDLSDLAEVYNVGIVAGIHFKEELITGNMTAGRLTSLEELGIAKVIARKFV